MPTRGGPGTAYDSTKRGSPCQNNAARYISKLSTPPSASVAVPSPWSLRDRAFAVSGESVSSPVNPVSITASIATSRPDPSRTCKVIKGSLPSSATRPYIAAYGEGLVERRAEPIRWTASRPTRFT